MGGTRAGRDAPGRLWGVDIGAADLRPDDRRQRRAVDSVGPGCQRGRL
jgi:hypothetical protein